MLFFKTLKILTYLHSFPAILCPLPTMDFLKSTMIEMTLILPSYSFISLTDLGLLILSNLIYFPLYPSDK